MPGSGVHTVQLILFLLLLLVAAFAAIARRLQTPYPIVLVIAGLLLGLVPGIPTITLDPDLIFLVVLPPLLYSAALVTSWRDFSHNLVSIAMLAFGLVGFTVLAVAHAGQWLFAGFDWRVGFVLGAVVATTDSIAASAIAKRIGLPKSIVDLLEGESLLNDATGLLVLEFATAMVVNGQNPSIGSSLIRLVYLTCAGIGTGLILGRVVDWFERRIDDGPIEIAVSILVPYAAYLTAEAIHASGVLAVVAAGLYLGRKSSEFLSPRVRLQSRAVWNSIEFILNGLVFMLIGLQLPSVLAGVSELGLGRLILYGAAFSVLLILLRLVWTFPGLYLAGLVRRHILRKNEKLPGARHTFVVGWTGMRGVIALAAALALPETVANGSPFPHKDLIVFLTFSVILVTLVFQGLTLPPLIGMLGLCGASDAGREEHEARRLVIEATLERLDGLRHDDSSGSNELYDDLERHYQHRLASVSGTERNAADSEQYFQYLELSGALLDVERQTALRLRDEGRITDEALRAMEHELDLNASRLTAGMDSRSTVTS